MNNISADIAAHIKKLSKDESVIKWQARRAASLLVSFDLFNAELASRISDPIQRTDAAVKMAIAVYSTAD